jgi:hypothetical protein
LGETTEEHDERYSSSARAQEQSCVLISLKLLDNKIFCALETVTILPTNTTITVISTLVHEYLSSAHDEVAKHDMGTPEPNNVIVTGIVAVDQTFEIGLREAESSRD